MTPDAALVLIVLAVSVLFLVTEWIPMEVTAMLALGTVAITGLVSPLEALSGFSNPAVVTVWAVFILSGGLTRTGVAKIIGRLVLRLTGSGERTMIVVIMTVSGVMSAFMNNVAVAALMLPVVMDVARHTGTAPSRLLMPLAYGSLLGGLSTQIGTPPNILVSDALREHGLTPFSFFDFTPIGLIVMVSGTAFMALIGHRLLPRRDVVAESSSGRAVDWKSHYDLEERLFEVSLPKHSLLDGKTLSEIRMGSVLNWNVIGVTHKEGTVLAPGPAERLCGGDLLVIEGRIENLEELKSWRKLSIEEKGIDITDAYNDEILAGEVVIPMHSTLVGKTLNAVRFRSRFGVDVVAIRRGTAIKRTKLQDRRLEADDILLISGPPEALAACRSLPEFVRFREISRKESIAVYNLHERLMIMGVPEASRLSGKTLKESRLGDAMGSRVLGILRGDAPILMPEPSEVLREGDRLVVEGSRSDFDILRGFEELIIQKRKVPDLNSLLTESVAMVEAILSPHTTLNGKTLRQLKFREKYGLNSLAIWRRGKSLRANIRDIELQFGDAMLVFGLRSKIRLLGREPDFIVLTESAQETPRLKMAKISTLIMAAVLLPVILGWIPIYISAVVGAAMMVLTGCLTVEEAYRQIEWKAVCLIAGMLPLGIALDQSGAARMIAEGVVALVGPYGPNAVMFGLVALTFMATCFVPTAALVVLMVPIVLNTSADMGLSPYALMMAVAMASSASFTTPISHPANILVMGPGGYRFMDYLKVGGLLTLFIMGVLMVALPLLWPLT